MANDAFIKQLLATIDARDAKAFAGFLTSDATFRFGNHPAVLGREAIEATVGNFLRAIKSVSHALEEQWSLPDVVICTGMVIYIRHDGGTLRVPFANILKLRPAGIYDYRIFVDNSALFAP
ncbi:MAG TPA: nuclear transport factor 2 family protein [Burkholderiales bacterium]|nr:nuclear transport factor 2 family protein [Burkholderiales bacterium]